MLLVFREFSTEFNLKDYNSYLLLSIPHGRACFSVQASALLITWNCNEAWFIKLFPFPSQTTSWRYPFSLLLLLFSLFQKPHLLWRWHNRVRRAAISKDPTLIRGGTFNFPAWDRIKFKKTCFSCSARAERQSVGASCKKANERNQWKHTGTCDVDFMIWNGRLN